MYLPTYVCILRSRDVQLCLFHSGDVPLYLRRTLYKVPNLTYTVSTKKIGAA